MAQPAAFIEIPWTSQPPAGTPIDWSNPLTRGLHCVFVPEGNVFREIIRSVGPNTVNGTPTEAIVRGRPPFKAVDFGVRTSTDYLFYDIELGFADHEAISMAILYAGTDEQTVVAGDLFGVYDSSRDAYYQNISNLTGNSFRHVSRNASTQSASGTTTVLYDTGDKDFALIGTNGYPVQTGGVWFDIWIDGVVDGTNAFDLRGDEDTYDRVAIGVAGDSTVSTNGGGSGSIGLGLIWKGRNLSADEWRSLSENPWQIFEPQHIPVFKPAAATTPQPYYIEIPWTSQPPSGTRIDWSHPVCRDAAILVPGTAAGRSQEVYDEKGHTTNQLNSSIELEDTRLGQLPHYANSSSENWVPSDYNFTTGATDQFTVLWVADWQSGSFPGPWRVGTSGSSPIVCFYSSTGPYDPISIGNTDHNPDGFNPDSFGNSDFQKPHAAVFCMGGDMSATTGAGMSMFVDGKRSAISDNNATLAGATANDTRIGMGSSSSTYMQGLVGMFIFVPKLLPESVCRSWSENPYQIFEPQRISIFKPGAAGGDVDTNVSAGSVALTLSTQSATVDHDISVDAALATLTLATQAADVSLDRNIDAGVAALTLATQAATVDFDVSVEAAVKALTLTTYPASLDADNEIQASTAALTLATFAATVDHDIQVDAGLAALSLATQPATVDVDIEVEAGTATLTLTPQAATVDYDRIVNAGVKALTLTTWAADVDDGIAGPVTPSLQGRRTMMTLIGRGFRRR